MDEIWKIDEIENHENEIYNEIGIALSICFNKLGENLGFKDCDFCLNEATFSEEDTIAGITEELKDLFIAIAKRSLQ